MTRATAVLTGKGYKVREFFKEDTSVQSAITNRLSELRAAFSDDTISAVFCTIGGSTFTELLPALIADTELHRVIREHPKVVLGYSDITGLHWFLYALTGLRTFYGPGAIPELGDTCSIADETSPLAFCVQHLFRAVASRQPLGEIPRSLYHAPRLPQFFHESASTAEAELDASPKWTWLRSGKGEGRLFGGCVTIVARLQGVRAIAPVWRGRIVFLETASADDENKGLLAPRVSAAFADLIAQGVFDDVAGLVVGRPYGYSSAEANREYAEIITALFCEGHLADKKFPILFNVDFGHTTPMVTLPYDALAVLDSEKDSFAVIESSVV